MRRATRSCGGKWPGSWQSGGAVASRTSPRPRRGSPKWSRRLANVLAFVKGGRWSDTTKSELVQLEDEQKQLRHQLNAEGQGRPGGRLPAGHDRALQEGAGRPDHGDAASSGQGAGDPAGLDGREHLLHPTADGTERFLTAEVSGDYAGLFKSVSNGNLSKNKFGGGEGS